MGVRFAYLTPTTVMNCSSRFLLGIIIREGKIKDCRFLFNNILMFFDTSFKPTTLGGIGVSALTFLSNYQIPLK